MSNSHFQGLLDNRVDVARAVPPVLADYLVNRNSITRYNREVRPLYVGSSTTCPEYGSEPIGVTTLTQLGQPVGHPFILDDTDDNSKPGVYITGFKIQGLSGLMDVLRVLAMQSNTNAWVHSGVQRFMCEKQWDCLKRLSHTKALYAYNITAHYEMEAAGSKTDAWSHIPKVFPSMAVHYGLYGTLYDNNVISMTLPGDKYQGDESRDQYAKSFPKDCEAGFIDCVYTPASESAGSRRLFVHGTHLRVQTRDLLSTVYKLVKLIVEDETSLHTFHWYGVIVHLTEKSCIDIINYVRRNQIGDVTVYVLEDPYIISVNSASGAIMRPPYTNTSGPAVSGDSDNSLSIMVDSVTFHNPELSVYNVEVPPLSEPQQYVATILLLFPYTFHGQPPRPLLAVSMSTQALGLPYVEMSVRSRPSRQFDPIVCTPLLADTLKSIRGSPLAGKVSLPGCPLTVAFISENYAFEDAAILSSEVNRLKLFSHTAILCHPVPSHVPPQAPGSIIPKTTVWWRPSVNGKVINEGVNRYGKRYVRVELNSPDVEVGDKLATWCGQKFVVSQIRPPDWMPLCRCTSSGVTFRPHIIISCRSVFDRVTPNQLFEAFAAASIVDVSTFVPGDPTPQHLTDLRGLDGPSITPKVCTFTDEMNRVVYGPNLDTDESVESPSSVPCTANYGIIHVWQLGIFARDRQHYITNPPRSLTSVKGKLKGSGVRFGEMEVQSVSMNGGFRFLSDVIDSADGTVFEVCVKCRRQVVLCDCKDTGGVVKLLGRLPVLKLDVMLSNVSMYMGGIPFSFTYE